MLTIHTCFYNCFLVTLIPAIGTFVGTSFFSKAHSMTSIIDHISFSVNNYEESLHFYDQTLAELGYERIFTINIPEKNIATAGYGKDKKPSFWISPMGSDNEQIGSARGFHVAFLASNTQQINHWYKKCLELGGKDNGAPGPRPEYHPGYYGAFIVDPNGWRIEAAFHGYVHTNAL